MIKRIKQFPQSWRRYIFLILLPSIWRLTQATRSLKNYWVLNQRFFLPKKLWKSLNVWRISWEMRKLAAPWWDSRATRRRRLSLGSLSSSSSVLQDFSPGKRFEPRYQILLPHIVAQILRLLEEDGRSSPDTLADNILAVFDTEGRGGLSFDQFIAAAYQSVRWWWW